MKKLLSFILESYRELKYKVSWTSYGELQSATILVLVASVIFALMIGGIDFTFKSLMSTIYSSF